MIYSADLTQMSGKISHTTICKYVTDLNWHKYTGKTADGILFFQKRIDDVLYQITIPCDNELEDYSFAMRKAIKILSKTEKKSEEQIILELLNPMSDIIRIRDKNDNVSGGSILFEDGIKLFENAKKLISNAAQDVINYKKIYKGRPSEKLAKFIDQCRFGQTEIGSYVVSVVCPFANITDSGEYQQLSIFSEESEAASSITRKTTNKIFESIKTIKETLDNGQDLSSIIEDDSKKISVSFVESLMNLNLDNDKDSVEISAKLAPTIKENSPIISSITLTHDYYEPMKTIVEKYKNREELNAEMYEGKISELEAVSKLEDRKQGQAKLVYISGVKAKEIKLKMDKDNYDIAITAHKEGKTVRVFGEKSKSLLKNVTIEIL